MNHSSRNARHYGLVFGIGLMVLCSGTDPVSAQPYAIFGTVVDEVGIPVEQAEILLADAGKTSSEGSRYFTALPVTMTNKEGAYRITGLEPGTYTVAVFRHGRQMESNSVVISDKDVRLDITLRPLEEALETITVGSDNPASFGMTRLRAVEADALYDAKKNEVVVVDDIPANQATNNSRQVYAKVAGLNIWESDGAGIQLGIGGRGLSPSRNANFNTRQNGYDIAADALGYPESYYTPPIQALKQIEIVRGAASLQYGTQFGGLLNFVLKQGSEDKPIELTSMQTLGSFGLFNAYNSLGGTVGAVNYYAFHQYKRSDGWRPNEALTQHTAHASMKYNLSPQWSIRPEYTYMTYLAQQPGGLTDAQFETNPRQSNRERNWFGVHWNLWSVSSDYKFSSRTNANTRFFGLVASRDALGNLGRIDRLDFGGNRDLLRDRFLNWGNETRLIHRYPFLKQLSVFLIGLRYYNGFTDRKQGEGSDGDGPDFNYLTPDNLQGSDFDLPNQNISLFVENIFNLNSHWSLVPGIRLESIQTEAKGYYRNTLRDLAGNVLVDERINEHRRSSRTFVFLGLGLSYKRHEAFEAYGNFSQNYRAINFNDIRVNVGSLEVDPDIEDERGYNMEFGLRGRMDDRFDYDVSLFHLSYQDRIGTILRKAPNPQFNNLVDRIFRYRTNIADARIFGLESYAEMDLYKLLKDRSSSTRVSVFGNLALIRAAYAESEENGVEGNVVELVPEVNFKTGLMFRHRDFELAYQLSFLSEHFSDASNAILTPTAIEGIIPAYHVMDLSARYLFQRYRIDAGINNLLNSIYFTRRATGYPGPGILPSSGRSFYLTVGVRL